jgi:RNA polymerase sigma-70 factor (ECF subfamily)
LGTLAFESDEQQLIAAAQRDPNRFAALYEQNVDRVYAYVARRVRNRDLAEEISAEVFHHALANLSRYEWRGVPFSAWLIKIAANAIADGWNQQARQEPLPETDIQAASGGSQIEAQASVAQLVERLPSDQQLVLRRRFVEESSIREIAAELGRSEGAIKQLQFRALQNLRAMVKE